MKRNPYVRAMPDTWWLENSFYRFYILREATSIFVSAYSFFLLLGVYALTQGEYAWNDYIRSASSLGAVVFHIVCLGMVMLHAISWFQLTPKTMDVAIKGEPIPEKVIVNTQYGAFVAVSILIVVVMGGWL